MVLGEMAYLQIGRLTPGETAYRHLTFRRLALTELPKEVGEGLHFAHHNSLFAALEASHCSQFDHSTQNLWGMMFQGSQLPH